MNLKYYLRGLGIGIVVTAIIMSISASSEKETLSDAQIKARAAELGMVETSGVLSELEEPAPTESSMPTEEPVPTEEPMPTATPAPTKEPEPTEEPVLAEEPMPTATPAPTKEPEPTEEPAPTEEPTPTKEPGDAKMITIVVNGGESSYTICKRLEENGLIASASDFDTYLCDKGLDKKLRAGTFEIPENAETDDIAAILTIR